MEGVKLSILGCGSALPKPHSFHSSQLLEMRQKQFMIDCGEGTQIRMRQMKLHTNRLNHIFISHLHGDHFFGIPGLISTLGMLGRTADIVIHAHPELQRLMQPQLDFFCKDYPFNVLFESFSPYRSQVIYDDRSVTVTTVPLKHRVASSGFLFEEKPTERHIVRTMIDAYDIPIRAIKDIKAGADWITPEGEIVPNVRLTTDATPPKRFAYISDTAYLEKIVPIIEGVDCLYHEATFLDEDSVRIKATLHSSAKQAATIALKAHVGKLIIGHFSARYKDTTPFLKEAKSVFENSFAAKDGDVFWI